MAHHWSLWGGAVNMCNGSRCIDVFAGQSAIVTDVNAAPVLTQMKRQPQKKLETFNEAAAVTDLDAINNTDANQIIREPIAPLCRQLIIPMERQLITQVLYLSYCVDF